MDTFSQAFSLAPSQELKQSQRLTPAQLQGLDLLQCPSFELLQKISVELQNNPVLEQNLEKGSLSDEELWHIDNELNSRIARRDMDLDEDGDAYHDELLVKSIEDRGTGAASSSPANEEQYEDVPEKLMQYQDREREERRAFLFDSHTGSRHLYGSLVSQLNETAIGDPSLEKLAHALCSYIDAQGYLLVSDEELCSDLKCTDAELHQAVQILQHLSPVGIASRNLRECLLAQLEAQGVSCQSIPWRLVSECSEELKNGNISRITLKLGISEAELEGALRELRRLNPCPGYELDSEISTVIIPDVYFERKNSKSPWTVRMNDSIVPELTINEDYLAMSKDSKTPRDTRDYLKDKCQKAEKLISALGMRSETLLMVSGEIARRQEKFLASGRSDELLPMNMEDVAKALDVAVSTVSRAVNGKFACIPSRTLPFKDFFSAHVMGGENGVSNLEIRRRLKEMIQKEDRHKPLSDQQLSDMLKGEGFPVERRTVAKYRALEGIGGTAERRIR